MDVGLLLVRLVVGLLFVGHGSQKLFGWFGGYGLQGTGGFFAKLGYRGGPGVAFLAGATEFGAGALLALGWLIPFATAGIIGVMFNAMISVHVRNGMWNTDGGVEYPLVMSTIAAALAFAGPGAYSVDAGLGWDLAGAQWGASAILLGLIVGTIVVLSRRPAVEAQQQQAPEERRDTRAA